MTQSLKNDCPIVRLYSGGTENSKVAISLWREGKPRTSDIKMLDGDRRVTYQQIEEKWYTEQCLPKVIESMENVITSDEWWIFEYDPETKRQSSEWHTTASPRPKKGRMSKSIVKTMLIVFFDIKGIVHHEFFLPGQTVNAKFYAEVLRRLKRRVSRVRQDIAADWKWHHDKAQAHTAFLVNSYLTKAGTPTLPQPPYSPDVPPGLFVVSSMKGKHFETTEGIQAACTAALKAIP